MRSQYPLSHGFVGIRAVAPGRTGYVPPRPVKMWSHSCQFWLAVIYGSMLRTKLLTRGHEH